MKTKNLTLALCAGALVLCVSMAACTSSGSDAGSSSSDTTAVEYSDDSLIAYHESIGQDISYITEVSVDNCSECHGDLATIKEATEDILDDGVYTANPHTNHMFTQYDCEDCHSLTGTSGLTCNTQCHEWSVTTDTGIFDGSGADLFEGYGDDADDEAEEAEE